MTRIEVVRYSALLLPWAGLWVATRWGPRTRREYGALLLAGIAAFVGLGVLHEVSGPAGWWHYLDVAGSWRGFPVDLWLGWAVLWGPLPVALRRHVGAVPAVLAAAWLDVLAMPAMAPVVALGEGWLRGEAIGLLAVLVPAMLLGRWTADAHRLVARVVLQIVTFAGLALWLLPTTAFTLGDGGWSHLLDLTFVQWAVVLQLGALIALPALSAVQELAERGGGTPFPWDPPRRLVTSGPYAYLANPMQVSVTLMLLLLAALGRSWALAGAVVVAVAFSSVVAGPHEHEHLRGRFGNAFDRYRAEVPAWWPRRRPFVPGSATLFVSRECGLCRQLGAVVFSARPTQLERADAEDHDRDLRRVRYEHTDGHAEDGLPAIGRALEHLHLAAAAIGFLLRLPLLRRMLQLVADTVGPPPRSDRKVEP